MSVDFKHDAQSHAWVHPDTDVRIACEDMPTELLSVHPIADLMVDVLGVPITDWQHRMLPHID